MTRPTVPPIPLPEQELFYSDDDDDTNTGPYENTEQLHEDLVARQHDEQFFNDPVKIQELVRRKEDSEETMKRKAHQIQEELAYGVEDHLFNMLAKARRKKTYPFITLTAWAAIRSSIFNLLGPSKYRYMPASISISLMNIPL